MKIINLFLVILLLVMCITACYIPVPQPDDGVWYCEDLRISIDFSLSSEATLISRMYNLDGTSKPIVCHFGYDNSLIFLVNEEDTAGSPYFSGTFVYEDNEFRVTDRSDGKVYIFNRIDG